jgi:hypothetical protein
MGVGRLAWRLAAPAPPAARSAAPLYRYNLTMVGSPGEVIGMAGSGLVRVNVIVCVLERSGCVTLWSVSVPGI